MNLSSTNVSFESCVNGMESATNVKSNSLNFKLMIRLSIALWNLFIILVKKTAKRWTISQLMILDITYNLPLQKTKCYQYN